MPASPIRYRSAVEPLPPFIGVTITAPSTGAVLAQGTPVTVTGSTTVAASSVSVGFGATSGLATITGLTWSYTFTPGVGDIGPQWLSATATAAAGCSTATTCTQVSVGAASATFNGVQMASLSATKNLTANAANAPTIHQSQTLVCLFYWAPGTSPAYVASLWNAIDLSVGTNLKGWILQFSNAAQFPGPVNNLYLSVLAGSGAQNLACGQPVLGYNCVAITRDTGNVLRASLNGGAIKTLTLGTNPTDPGASATHSLGGGYTGAHGFDVGAILEAAAINRLYSDAELQQVSSVVYPSAPANRYALPALVSGDAALTFSWKAARDWNGSAGTSTSQGSAPVTFTVNGSPKPTLVAVSEQYSSALVFQDAGVASLVSGGGGNYWHTDCYARLVNNNLATAQAGQVAVAYYNNDPTTSTNGSERVPIYLNGAWVADAPAVPDHNAGITLVWAQLAPWNAALPSGTVEFWAPGTLDPTAAGGTVIGGYIAGIVTGPSPTFDASLKTKRLVCVGDSLTLGFFSNTGGGEWVARVRADFPTVGTGGITVDCYGGRRLYDLVGGIGAPLAGAAADTLVAKCQVANGGTKYLHYWFGYNDAGHSPWTAAQFGAAYQALINAVNARDASILQYVSNLPQTTGAPAALPSYNTQIGALSGKTLVETTDLGLTYVDNVHLDAASQITYKNRFKSVLAY